MMNLGINIGSNRTVYSICGYNQNGTFLTKTLLNDASKRETPSLLVFTQKERKAGSTAITDFKTNAESSFINISRLIGLNYLPNIEDELKYNYVKSDIINEGNNKKVMFKFKFEENFYQAESNEIVASYIQKINKQYLKNNSDFQFEYLTISIPDFYSLSQKQAIQIILKAVGAKNINIINESTAITFYYGYNRYKDFFQPNKNIVKNVIFVDSGHSKTTFFLSEFKFNEFKVLFVKSIPFLGGRDFDEALFKYAKIQYKIQFGFDFPVETKKKVLLFQQIQKCRENLSVNSEIDIKLESFYKDKDFIVKLSRDKLEGLTFHLLEIFSKEFHSFFNTCKNILNQNKIDHIEMVGGLVRTPLIEYYLTKISGIKLSKTNLVDECTAVGAALFNFYNNWIDKKETKFPIKDFKTIIGYNYENIFCDIIDKNTLVKNNSNQTTSTPLPDLKEINADNKSVTYEFEKGCELPSLVNLKLKDNNNLNDNSQVISFFRKDNQKNKIVLINYKIFLPTYKQNTEYTEKSNYQSKSNHLHQNNLENKKSQEYNIYFYLNHCGYINLYKKQNFKNEETIKDYKIIDQELIDEFDCDNIIKTIINFINKIENIDKNENKLQEEKNKLSSLFYEQRSLIRSGSMREITILNDQMNSIERDLRNLNKIINKNEVKIGIEKIKGKLDKVKRSISEKNNKRMISKSMIDNDEKYEIDYYKKKNNQTKKRNIDWTPNLYTYKKEDKVHDNSFIKSNNINNIINNNKNEQKKANFYNKIPPNKTQNPQINFEFYNKKGDMKKDNYNFFYGDQYMP